MKQVRYKGHPTLGHVYRTMQYHVKEGRIVEVSDDEATRLTTTWPDAFEVVGGQRDVEKPEHDRMLRKPRKRRAKI